MDGASSATGVLEPQGEGMRGAMICKERLGSFASRSRSGRGRFRRLAKSSRRHHGSTAFPQLLAERTSLDF